MYPIDEAFSTIYPLRKDITAGQKRDSGRDANQTCQRLPLEGLELLPFRNVARLVDEQIYAGRLNSEPTEAHPQGRFLQYQVLVHIHRCMPLSRIVLGAVDPLGGKREDLDAHQDGHRQYYACKWFHDTIYCKNDAIIGEGGK